jgi:hypothetical protein
MVLGQTAVVAAAVKAVAPGSGDTDALGGVLLHAGEVLRVVTVGGGGVVVLVDLGVHDVLLVSRVLVRKDRVY